MKTVITFVLFTVVISALIRALFGIVTLINRKNFEASFTVFLNSFIGGFFGGSIGLIVGFFVGWITDKNTPGSIFVMIDGGIIAAIFLIFTIWIIGIIIGAVVGGFREMDMID